MKRVAEVAAQALPWGLALNLSVAILGPNALGPAATLWVGLGLPALLASLLVWERAPRLDSSVVIALSGYTIAGAWFAARAGFAVNPFVAWWGSPGQHNGTALWISAALWLACGLMGGSRRVLYQGMAVISGAGAIYSVLAVAEALLSGPARRWGSVAGPFENSSSLGQFLAMAVAVSVGLALASRNRLVRASAAASAVLAGLGLVVAGSRSGMTGLALGGLAAGAIYVAPYGRRTATALATSIMAAVVASGLAAGLAGAGSLGAGARRVAASTGNLRDAIWSSAWVHFLENSRVAGSGLEQFSAWVQWSFSASRGLDFNATYDPHNVILSVLVGAGLFGLTLWVAALWWLLRLVIVRLNSSRRPRALLAIVAALGAVIGSSLFSWLAPAAVISAAVLCGLLLAATSPGANASHRTRPLAFAVAGVLIIAGIAVAVLTVPGVRSEYQWAVGNAAGTMTPQQLVDLYEAWPEPAYAAQALAELTKTVSTSDQSANLARDLATQWSGQRVWHVDLTIRSLFLYQSLSVQRGEDTWTEFQQAVTDGRAADPASGIWDFLAALEAERLGRSLAAEQYARQALDFSLSPEEAQAMRGVLERASAGGK